MQIGFTSSKYWEQRRADKKSLLWITYVITFYLVLWAWIIKWADLFTVPTRLEQVWLYLVFLPVLLTVISILLAMLHGFTYLISLIFRYNYKDSIVSKKLENLFVYIFPAKLYTKPSFKSTGSWSIKERWIYFGVILNIFVLITVILFSLFTDFEWIRSSVYDITNLIKDLIHLVTHRQTRW